MNVPKGDYGYYLTFTIVDSAGVAYNISGYTITLKVRRKGTTDLIISGSCSIISAPAGTCHYMVLQGDFKKIDTLEAYAELVKTGIRESTELFTINVV